MSLLKKFLWKLWVPILQLSWQFSAKSPFFPQNSEKLPPAPHSEKKYQTELFSRNKKFLEKFIWTNKDTILTICFQSSKNICRMSRKSLEDNESTKKDRLPKKTLQICRIPFWQSCWNFSKIVRNSAPKFYEIKRLDFWKKFSNCFISFQVKKSPGKTALDR